MSQIVRRTRMRAGFLVGLAVVVASSTAYAAWQVVRQYESQLAAARDAVLSTKVVVAKRDLRAGESLKAADVELVDWAQPVDVKLTYVSVEDVVGATVGDRILKGEVLRAERLVDGGAGLDIHELLEPGMRAVTIRSERAAGVGGLLRPGHVVDVIVTIRPDENGLDAKWVTETILQGVHVIAVNDEVGNVIEERAESKDPKARKSREVYVTLEVRPAEAEQLAMATSRGEVHISLRALDDFERVAESGPLVTNRLMGLPERVARAQERKVARVTGAPAPKAVEAAHTTEIIRGAQTTVEQFDKDGARITQPRR
jgi:pilus assembly protein CpaB